VALRLVRRLRRRHAGCQIILTGCLVDRKLHDLDGVDLLVPTRQKHLIAGLIADPDARTTFMPCFDGGYRTPSISSFSDHTRAFVKIQEGCNYNCSFCKIPQVRGRSSSRPLPEIVEEIQRLVSRGHHEVVLTGVSLGNYGKEWTAGPDLADVIAALLEIERLARLRVSSIEPSDVSQRLLEIMASSRRVCRHLHLPLQSGSTRILKLMRRHYTATAFCELVAQAKRWIPGLSLTTDVIVGFPTETDEDHTETEAVLEHVQPIRAHLFSYSPRKGTLAATYRQHVAPQIVRMRMERLRALQAALTACSLKSLVGEELEVLVEASRDPHTHRLEGYTDTYVKCFLDGPDSLMNQLVRVRIIEAHSNHVLASMTTQVTEPARAT
jgi:threonylcarbamoyladenosine tRNA methylthiotransferase MtaB